MKTLFTCTILVITLLISYNNCKAQLLEDIKCAKTLLNSNAKINYSEFAKGSKNEIESTFSVAFILYKNFISSQDIDACVFYPSCSVYAIECIHHEKRKVIAFLKISDRILRCHPLVSPGTYKIDNHTGKFFDPIEN